MMLTEQQTRILQEVRAFLGEGDFTAVPGRWMEAVRRDSIALKKALADTRHKVANPGRDPLRSKGGYMWRAFLSQEAVEIQHRTEGPRR